MTRDNMTDKELLAEFARLSDGELLLQYESVLNRAESPSTWMKAARIVESRLNLSERTLNVVREMVYRKLKELKDERGDGDWFWKQAVGVCEYQGTPGLSDYILYRSRKDG